MLATDKVERVPCPFDPVHVIERRRLQAHIIKCKRNLPAGHDFVQCNFWYNHFVRQHELEEHHQHCEHRQKKEADMLMWEAEPAKFNQPKLTYSADYSQDANEENWEDCSAPAFDPEKLRATAAHMPVPEGLTKSKRKEFVENERLRLRDIEEKSALETKKKKMDEPAAAPAPAPVIVPTNVAAPRKPATVSGRIAARFPGVNGEPSGRSEGSSSMNSYHSAAESLNTSGISVGRGRGILGWNTVAESRRPYNYSPGEFPNLDG